jgi:hypothetical protein
MFLAETTSMGTSDSHPLAEWIEAHSTRGEFARGVDCSVSHLNNILARRKQPSLDLLERINRRTAGAVGLTAFRTEEASL